jgi:hypothetical protein
MRTQAAVISSHEVDGPAGKIQRSAEQGKGSNTIGGRGLGRMTHRVLRCIVPSAVRINNREVSIHAFWFIERACTPSSTHYVDVF